MQYSFMDLKNGWTTTMRMLIPGNRPEATPLVLGHEGIGEVVSDQSLDKNSILPPGTRVSFSIGTSCSQCARCRVNLPEKCEFLHKVGHTPLKNKPGFSGCYATHLVLCRGSHIIPVPPHLSDRMVAPINCALATMVNAVEKADTGTQNKSALILGAGLLGIYGCALLNEKGYERVYCSDVTHDRLKFISKFGGTAVHADQFLDEDFLVQSVDTVIEVCGNPGVVQDGYRSLRHGGVMVLVGLVHPNSALTITGEEIIRRCITIKGVHNYSPRHLDDAMKFISNTADRYPYESLLSPNEFSLEEIESAVMDAERRLFHRTCIRP